MKKTVGVVVGFHPCNAADEYIGSVFQIRGLGFEDADSRGGKNADFLWRYHFFDGDSGSLGKQSWEDFDGNQSQEF